LDSQPRPKGGVHLGKIGYSVAVKREDIAGNRLRATADKLYDGEMVKLLPYLIRSQKLSANDRANLRKVFDELDRKDPEKGK
jgi:predicted transcriptional regulator